MLTGTRTLGNAAPALPQQAAAAGCRSTHPQVDVGVARLLLDLGDSLAAARFVAAHHEERATSARQLQAGLIAQALVGACDHGKLALQVSGHDRVVEPPGRVLVPRLGELPHPLDEEDLQKGGRTSKRTSE